MKGIGFSRQVFYIGLDGQVHELVENTGQEGWLHLALTDGKGNRVGAAAASALTSCMMFGVNLHVYYVGTDRDIHELMRPPGGEATNLNTVAAGNPVDPAPTSALTSFAWNSTTTRVYYIGVDGHVHELGWNGGTWWHTDVTQMVNGSPIDAAANSGLTSFAWNSTTTRVYYTGVDGHVHELGWNDGAWGHTDVTAIAKGSPIDVAAGSSLTSFALNSTTTRVYYIGVDGHVHELGWNDGAWWHTDVTAMVL